MSLEHYALRIWERLPQWICDDAPLPVLEWVQARKDSTFGEFISTLMEFQAAFDRLADAGNTAARSFNVLASTLTQIKRQHPEWFDPDTGYLLES